MYIAVKSTFVEVANPYYSSWNQGTEPRTVTKTEKDYIVFSKDSDVASYKTRGYTVYTIAEEIDVEQIVTTKIIAKPLI